MCSILSLTTLFRDFLMRNLLFRFFKLLCDSTGFCWTVRQMLPWRFRRMIVLSGCFGLLSSLDKPLLTHSEELSEVLNLARNPDSIKVPIKLHSIIVSQFSTLNLELNGKTITINDVVEGNLSEEVRMALSEKMAYLVPPSLCYSLPNCMAYDFYRLLGFVSKIKTA